MWFIGNLEALRSFVVCKNYSLFVDDCRDPKTDRNWKVARDFSEMEEILEENGTPKHVSFDHDLGEGKADGGACAMWMLQQGIVPESYNVHSANPPGAKKIESIFDTYEKLHDVEFD